MLKISEHIAIKNGKNRKYFTLECSCGKQIQVRADGSQKIKSCGCKRSETTHRTHSMSGTKIHNVWLSMKYRCFNKNCKQFNDYGGRGISICEEWRNNFMSFYNWSISNGYKDGLSIDRINNDGNYEPSNCRFVTKTIQQRNQRILRKNNTSNYRGVSKRSDSEKYRARITVDNKEIQLGIYTDPKDAAMAYDTFVIVYGLQHTTNFPKGVFE